MCKKYRSSLISSIKKKGNRTILSALSYGTASVMTQFLMMVYLVIVAQWLGADQYGYIAAAFAATSLSSFVFNWGFNEWMIREGSTSDNVQLLAGKVIYVKAVLGVLWGITLFMILRLVRPAVYLDDVLLFSIIDVYLDSILGTALVIFILKDRVPLASVLLILSRLLRVLGVLVLLFVGIKSIFLVMMLRLVATLIIFVVTLLLTKPTLRGFTLLSPFSLFKQSAAFNTGELLNLIYLNADVNLLVWFGAESELIANYSIVISLVNAVITLPSGIYNVLLPSLVRTYHQLRERYLKKFRYVYAAFLGLGLLLWLGASTLSKPLIPPLLGDSYTDSIQLMVIISPLLALRTINQANVAYLIAVGWQAKRLLPQAIALIAKIAAGIFAVSRFQVMGMVMVAMGSEGLLFMAYLIQAGRHYSQLRRRDINEDSDDIL